MTTQKITIKCGRCNGTGIDDNKKDENGNPIPESCTSCDGDGFVESGDVDSTELTEKLESLQLSIDQVAEIVKEDSEYIRKIYEIISKEK